MNPTQQPEGELDAIFLQYHAELSQGLNELAGSGTALDQVKKALLAWRDTYAQEKVREAKIDLLERICCCDYEPISKTGEPIGVCSATHVRLLATLKPADDTAGKGEK